MRFICRWRMVTPTLGFLLITLSFSFILNKLGIIGSIFQVLNWWPLAIIFLGVEVLIEGFLFIDERCRLKSGRVEAESIGGNLKIYNTNGSINVKSVDGSLTVDNKFGDITASNKKGKPLNNSKAYFSYFPASLIKVLNNFKK